MRCAYHPGKPAQEHCEDCGRACCTSCLPPGMVPPLCPVCSARETARTGIPIVMPEPAAPAETPDPASYLAAEAPAVLPTPGIFPFSLSAGGPIPSLPTPVNTPVNDGPRIMCPQAKRALRLAIIGIVCGGFFLEIPALILASQAKKLITLYPSYDGKKAATAAQVIAIVYLSLFSLGIIIAYLTGMISTH
jgi:hypothetical protein